MIHTESNIKKQDLSPKSYPPYALCQMLCLDKEEHISMQTTVVTFDNKCFSPGLLFTLKSLSSQSES